MKIKRGDLKRLIESFLNEEESGSGGLSSGSGPMSAPGAAYGGGEVDSMGDTFQGDNPFSKRSGGQGERKRAPGGQMGGIANIQRMLNKVRAQGYIDGDYQGRKLNDDGKWGPRTRSAASKFLKKLIDDGLQKKLGLTDHKSSKNLNVEKSGGEGKWRGAVQHLCEDTPKENASTEDQLEFVLDRFLAANITSPGSAEGGSTKEYFYSPQSKTMMRVTKEGNKIVKIEQFITAQNKYEPISDAVTDLGGFYADNIVKAGFKKVTKAEEIGDLKSKADKVLAESRGTLYRRRYRRY